VFYSKCAKCGFSGSFEVHDNQDKNKIPSMIELDIRDFDVVENSFNNKYQFYYEIPRKEYKRLNGRSKDFEYLSQVPIDYINSVKKKNKILFKEDKLFFMKETTIKVDPLFDFIGVPKIYWVLDDVFFGKSLKKSDQLTVVDKLQGMQYISPAQPTSEGAGPASSSTVIFKEKVEKMIRDHKINPNQTFVMPYPIYYGRAGGDGKSYFNLQEAGVTTQTIINGLGYPMEFYSGGMQWSGSNVSLRMLEVEFINFREVVKNLIKEYAKKVSTFKNWPEIPELDFKDFKMADDIQLKNQETNLASSGKISWTNALKNQGYDYIKEMQVKKSEMELELEIAILEAKKNAIGVKYSTKAQMDAQLESSRSKIEATLRNGDGSDDVKDIVFTADTIKEWKEQNI
jgi:hypothetical protein